MAEKIKVVICSGTACYVMGASDILLLEEQVPDDLVGKIEVEGATCLGLCKDGLKGKAPFVLINGEVMAQATLPDVVYRIRELIDAEHQ